MYSYITDLECTNCGEHFAAKQMTKAALADRPWNLCHYHEIMPVQDPVNALTPR